MTDLVALDRRVEDALFHCGRDRVLYREGRDGTAVAIRYDVPSGAASPDGIERYLVRKADSIDEAARQAASAFAAHLRARAREIDAWAERIEGALGREAPP